MSIIEEGGPALGACGQASGFVVLLVLFLSLCKWKGGTSGKACTKTVYAAAVNCFNSVKRLQ